MKREMPSIAARIIRSRFTVDICVVIAALMDGPGRVQSAARTAFSGILPS